MKRIYTGNKVGKYFTLTKTDTYAIKKMAQIEGVSESTFVTLALKVALSHPNEITSQKCKEERKRATSHNAQCDNSFLNNIKAENLPLFDYLKNQKKFNYDIEQTMKIAKKMWGLQ